MSEPIIGQCPHGNPVLLDPRSRCLLCNPEGADAAREELIAEVERAHAAKLAALREEKPEPIGNCPKCGVAVYTDEGYCGVCRG